MKQLHPSFRLSERGVTMIEMVVVLALISIMALVTVPNFISLYQSSRVKATARSMISDVRNARQLAIANNTRTRITFKLGTNIHQYELFRERKDRLTGVSTWDSVKWGDLGSVVYFQSSTFESPVSGSGWKDIIFRPNGTLDPDCIPDAEPWQVTLKTEQNISKQTYRLEFTATGNVVLR